MNTLHIQPFCEAHAAACAEIAQTAPDPWQRQHFDALATAESQQCYVAVLQGQAVGFACFLALQDTADLQLIAVSPAFRRQQVARHILQYAFEALNRQGVERCLLEVRQSNAAALSLYHSLGFTDLALRKQMYQSPAEDGLLLVKLL